MRIEISSSGFGGAAISELQSNLNTYIGDAESILESFKTIKESTAGLNGGAGNLQEALENIDSRARTEESKIQDAKAIQNRVIDFVRLAVRVDQSVSEKVNCNKDELYRVNPWLKPTTSVEEEIPWYEQAWNWLCGAGETVVEGAKQAWNWISDTAVKAWNGIVAFYNEHKKIIDTVLIVVGAVVAIAAVIATGGLAGAALVPLLTALGASTAVASAISATVAVIAVVSTVAASTLNIFDVWMEIDNPMFNGWQKGLNITSAVSNILYSVGGIYNSIKGYKMFSRIDWSGYPEGAQKPTGFYRVLEGEEYDAARKLANTTNNKLHRLNPDLAGLQIHEIHPVKFGGSPDNILNKLFLTPEEHSKFTVFWNRFMRGL